MQTKKLLVLACSIALFSQGARCAHFSLNITLTSDSPLNCSTGLTYPGPAFVRVEYRWLQWLESDGNNESLIPDQWSTLRTMNTCKCCIVFCTYCICTIFTDADYNVTGQTLQSSENENVDAVQLRIVQPEHGGGLCNCWEISELLIVFDDNSYLDFLNE